MVPKNSIFNHPEFPDLIERVRDEVEKAKRPSEEVIYDDVDLREFLKVSKRTTAYWREKGLITFSKLGGKIYYRLSDILLLLKKYEVPAIDDSLKIQL
jgi:hypothetical protein